MLTRLHCLALIGWMSTTAWNGLIAADVIPQAVVIYADRENGFELTTLLLQVGVEAKPVRNSAVTEDWTTDVDLVVVAACCQDKDGDPAWSPTLLDRIGDARVLACGNAGARLYETKNLIVSRPNSAHWKGHGVTARFDKQELDVSQQDIFKHPIDLQLKADADRTFGISIHEKDADPGDSLGIHDGGAFPEGTTGFARISQHHWLISQQGNYMLWGPDARADEMTKEAKQLWANLAWRLAHASPAPLVFPAKKYVEKTKKATLVGGWTNEYFHAIARPGEITLRLVWELDEPMMLMTHGPFVRRVDGKSPLEITYPVNEPLVGEEIQIDIASFNLDEGKELPYRLDVVWTP
jgi:hypothetical protein